MKLRDLEWYIMAENLNIIPFNRFQYLLPIYKHLVFLTSAKLFLNLHQSHIFPINVIIFHYVIYKNNSLLYNSIIIIIALISSLYYIKILRNKIIIHYSSFCIVIPYYNKYLFPIFIYRFKRLKRVHVLLV